MRLSSHISFIIQKLESKKKHFWILLRQLLPGNKFLMVSVLLVYRILRR